MLCRMRDKPGELAAENAGEVLAAIAKARSCPLTALLSMPDKLQQLLATGLESIHGTTLVQVCFWCCLSLRSACKAATPRATHLYQGVTCFKGCLPWD